MTKFDKLIYKRELRLNMFYYNKVDFHDEFSLTSLAKLNFNDRYNKNESKFSESLRRKRVKLRFYLIRLLSKFI